MQISQTSKSLASNIPNLTYQISQSSTSRISQSPISRLSWSLTIQISQSLVTQITKLLGFSPCGSQGEWEWSGVGGTAHWPVSTRPPNSAQAFQQNCRLHKRKCTKCWPSAKGHLHFCTQWIFCHKWKLLHEKCEWWNTETKRTKTQLLSSFIFQQSS